MCQSSKRIHERSKLIHFFLPFFGLTRGLMVAMVAMVDMVATVAMVDMVAKVPRAEALQVVLAIRAP